MSKATTGKRIFPLSLSSFREPVCINLFFLKYIYDIVWRLVVANASQVGKKVQILWKLKKVGLNFYHFLLNIYSCKQQHAAYFLNLNHDLKRI